MKIFKADGHRTTILNNKDLIKGIHSYKLSVKISCAYLLLSQTHQFMEVWETEKKEKCSEVVKSEYEICDYILHQFLLSGVSFTNLSWEQREYRNQQPLENEEIAAKSGKRRSPLLLYPNNPESCLIKPCRVKQSLWFQMQPRAMQCGNKFPIFIRDIYDYHIFRVNSETDRTGRQAWGSTGARNGSCLACSHTGNNHREQSVWGGMK